MYQQIFHDEAWELVKKCDVVIIDVRNKDSYEEAHIANAMHLSTTKLQQYCGTWDKQRPILVYCYHGTSSRSIAQHLVERGFKKIYSLIGGFEIWKVYHPTSDSNELCER